MPENHINLSARDLPGVRKKDNFPAPTDYSVEEVINWVTMEMQMDNIDSEGQSLCYHATVERDGQVLSVPNDEKVGSALKEGETIVLHPDITAG